jgi:hypothetical protein
MINVAIPIKVEIRGTAGSYYTRAIVERAKQLELAKEQPDQEMLATLERLLADPNLPT